MSSHAHSAANGRATADGCALLSEFDCNTLVFYVNGTRVEEAAVEPRTTLAVYLRDHLALKGTKIGCNEGGCGACTVMISDMEPASDGRIRHYSANACITPVCAVFGKAVTTVEGIGGPGSARKTLHPVQERLSKAHGSQCGYCTPGFVMAMYALLRNHPKPTQAQIDEGIQGNLCRCTGYRPILEAFYSFMPTEGGTVKAPAPEKSDGGCCGNALDGQCCMATNGHAASHRDSQLLKLTSLDGCAEYDGCSEPIFPPDLKLHRYHCKSFALEREGVLWLQPTSLAQLLSLKRRFPQGRLISGNSELAVELKFRFIDLSVAINPKQVPQLREVRLHERDGLYVGMGHSLTELKDILRDYIARLPESQTAVFRDVCRILHYFAGKHVRNMASVAGNIATGSPISDLNPIWMACGARVVLESELNGERTVALDERFFVGYRRTVIGADEVLKGIWIPLTSERQHFRTYKQAQRRDDDIAIVTGSFWVAFEEQVAPESGHAQAKGAPDVPRVREMRMAFGGMAPTSKMALETVKGPRGRAWDLALMEELTQRLAKEMHLPPDVPGGMCRYRKALTLSFFYKFFLHVAEALHLDVALAPDAGDRRLGEPQLPAFSATQIYQAVASDQPPEDPVGRPIQHRSGDKHTTGEAVYCTDTNVYGCLHLAPVLSVKACATVVSVDVTAALALAGVVGFVDESDAPGERLMLGHHADSPIFARGCVEYQGQPILAIVAGDHETARRAANLVRVELTEHKPIVTIEEAIAEESYLLGPSKIHSSLAEGGDRVRSCSDWKATYTRMVEGEVRMGGQEHFYLETQNCVAVPGEDDEMEVVSATQGASDVQADVARALDVARHKVRVSVRRIGGGFGGKESVAGVYAAMAALAARKLRRPVRLTLERCDDMLTSGNRHPFLFRYRMAVDGGGRFLDMRVEMYNNAGFSLDLSQGVLARAMSHVDSVYKWPNADVYGRVCKTNLASNTAYRGFGAPQAMFATESMIKHAAEALDMDVDEIRERNLYNEGDCTHFGMHLHQCNIRRCWTECMELADYQRRKELVRSFNAGSAYRKRGIYVVPTKFAIAFGLKHLNQAGALVHVYLDGSVLVSHAGMEMGQGLHTKILQIAARCLQVDMALIHVQDTASDKVPNTSPTAASVGSDLNGLAVQDACQTIVKRLEPFKQANPGGGWTQWVKDAYLSRVSLSSTGFGMIEAENIDFASGRGCEAFSYCVYGVACAEVEVDCLTGDHHVLRADVVMDVGESLNPAVDIGQIEGAFVQGYGLYTMEQVRVRPDGTRLTRGPGAYKIPSADDAPRQFNVKLLRGSSNRKGIFSSKAVGEPPLFLGCSVLFAIREAVRAYRLQNGVDGHFRFDSPATPERIRMACQDAIVAGIAELPPDGHFVPWTVEL